MSLVQRHENDILVTVQFGNCFTPGTGSLFIHTVASVTRACVSVCAGYIGRRYLCFPEIRPRQSPVIFKFEAICAFIWSAVRQVIAGWICPLFFSIPIKPATPPLADIKNIARAGLVS